MASVIQKARDATQAAFNRGEIPHGLGQIEKVWKANLARFSGERSDARIRYRRAALEGVDLGGES